MSSPFPGMDPYLEDPALWPDVHARLIAEMQTAINHRLRPHYCARVRTRVYFTDDPDAAGLEITERRIELVHRESGKVVTVIEVLSPANKLGGARGRESYLDKRKEVLASDAHLVEIDLLRVGADTFPRPPGARGDYAVCSSRSDRRPQSRVWSFRLADPMPVIGIPLKGEDPDAPLSLREVLDAAYDNAAYDLSVDYRRDPVPPLDRQKSEWAEAVLKEKGLR